MAKIAFCDDDVSVLDEMQRLMEQYCAERDCKIEYNIFNHPFDLVAEIEKGNRYDILFLCHRKTYHDSFVLLADANHISSYILL